MVAVRTTERMTAFKPGQSPPPVRIPSRTGVLSSGNRGRRGRYVMTSRRLDDIVGGLAEGGCGAVLGRPRRHDDQTSFSLVPLNRDDHACGTEVPLGPRAPAAARLCPARAPPPATRAAAVRRVRGQPDHAAP